MIKKVIRLINDFKDFMAIRSLNRTVELSGSHKSLIFNYNKDYEKEINALVLHRLSEMMVAEEISPEFYRGFRSALTQRISFLGLKDSKFPLNTNE